ncbi:hypothetical protein [Amycolatopsis sp.]|uniref:hypothetical protein n=1 Tax=Amycolatopsis sp. TaxID=37632 RepID=UPI002D7FE4E5|nr:hypothetical protein [Amycolatopsis sp.]HET6706261.1 hypothetical protein [Amycolatopsis sp.]
MRRRGPDLTDLVHAALDGLVFQQTAFADTTRTERAVEVLRKLLETYATATSA